MIYYKVKIIETLIVVLGICDFAVYKGRIMMYKSIVIKKKYIGN